MRAFIVLCLVAAACAQYNYGSGVSGGGSSGSSGISGGGSNYGGWNKEFYSFTAPEGAFDDPNAAQKLASAVKKNLRVIFIKNPENKAYEDAVLNLAKQAAQQRTAIYVLNKQHDLGDLANKFDAINKNDNNKPEVHFVKYRTPEDAANAQRAIQSQYDSLGGKSQNFNGGVAPVLNFASQGATHGHQGPSFGGQAPDSVYLPSSVFRKFRAIRRV